MVIYIYMYIFIYLSIIIKLFVLMFEASFIGDTVAWNSQKTKQEQEVTSNLSMPPPKQSLRWPHVT